MSDNNVSTRLVIRGSPPPPQDRQHQGGGGGDEVNDFFRSPSPPRSTVKRTMVMCTLDKYFAGCFAEHRVKEHILKKENNTGQDCGGGDGGGLGEFLSNYFDPFAGAGRYTNSESDLQMDLPTAAVTYGSPICALFSCTDTADKTFRASRIFAANNNTKKGPPTVKLARFYLGDVNQAHVDSLRLVMKRWLFDLGWKLDSREEEQQRFHHPPSFTTAATFTTTTLVCSRTWGGRAFQIRVHLSTRSFAAWDLRTLHRPLFSFVDPFGIEHVSAEKISRLAGPNSHLMFLLMASELKLHLDGADDNPKHKLKVDAHFTHHDVRGRLERAKELGMDPEWDGGSKAHFELEELAKLFCEQLEIFSGVNCGFDQWGERRAVLTARFPFRFGHADPVGGARYYLVYASPTISGLEGFKAVAEHFSSPRKAIPGLHPALEASYYSEYYLANKIEYEKGRKYTDAQEANLIYDHFKGLSVTKTAVQEFVLEQTGFAFHDEAVMKLVDDGLVESDFDPDDTGEWVFNFKEVEGDDAEWEEDEMKKLEDRMKKWAEQIKAISNNNVVKNEEEEGDFQIKVKDSGLGSKGDNYVRKI